MLKFLLTAVAISGAAGIKESGRVNPIRRVVTLLQNMQTKVTEEGKKEKELFDRFMCYCKTGTGDLEAAIDAAETKIPQVEKAIAESLALLKQLEDDLAKHKQDRADAKEALATASALREKEAAAYAKESGDLTTNVQALTKAIKVLSDGVAGNFLQTTSASAIRRLAVDAEMSSADRDMLTAFLSQGEGEGYVPQSGQIIGILKQMLDTMKKNLAEVNAAEEEAIKAFKGLAAAKSKEIQANTDAIEAKTVRHGETGVAIVNQKEDLDDTKKALVADKKFLADLETDCKTKEAEWDERSATRAQELLALADTIKILNDDDALELFKKTLPAPSLMQTTAESKDLRRRALTALNGARRQHDSRLSLVAMALRGSSQGFEKVIKMIDDMVALLGKEQVADDEKKAYCEAELDKAEDKLKGLNIQTADLEKAIDDANGQIATLADEIAALEAGIKTLDKEVAEATEIRKEEHATNVETIANDNAAKQLLEIAKNRLAKFYTPKLYKAAPKVELSAENRVVVSMGGTVAPTPAPGGIAGTGVVAFAEVSAHDSRVAPAPPPETWDAYTKKGEEHTGVVEMINMLKADLDKEIAETQVNEKEAQAEYETFMADSAAKRSSDTKSIAMKEAAKADLGAEIQRLTEEKGATMKEAMATAEYIKDMHLDCDWLLQNFQARKDARAGEVESLKNAKAA